MGETSTLKTTNFERPIELKIVVFLEAFVAVRYLIYAIVSFSASAPMAASLTYIALMAISILIAYGLWRFAKWAWVIAIALSVLGLVSIIPLLAMGGISIEMLWQYVPSIALDMLAIFLLFRKSVKSLFWVTKT